MAISCVGIDLVPSLTSGLAFAVEDSGLFTDVAQDEEFLSFLLRLTTMTVGVSFAPSSSVDELSSRSITFTEAAELFFVFVVVAAGGDLGTLFFFAFGPRLCSRPVIHLKPLNL